MIECGNSMNLTPFWILPVTRRASMRSFAFPEGPRSVRRSVYGAESPVDAQLLDDRSGRFLGAHPRSVEVNLRMLGDLVGRVDPGEVLELPAARLSVQPLDVATLRLGERCVDVNLEKLALAEQRARHAPLRAERRDEGHQHDET